ncbi:hypothetical protein [Flavobacterium urocaniciphilum]|uniref:Uncharacterized protein n=1 Tax=Flavobacterium urocaniciphilum TaxID=1299341 RepID=A0A1H8Z1K6_9FLAO|nr:hypothetical protein [Flavobacterium urocaniciphilum]SEP58211.1 hypothetical protein SAMN05444005_101424 [Flavobacterium urocaniciphilum]
MKKHKPKTSGINKTRQKKRQAFLNKYFMTAVGLFLLYYIFIESHYIGTDIRYEVFVFWIPVLTGIFVSIKFNFFQVDWNDIISDLKKEKNYFYKIITIPTLVLMYFIFGVIMFWMPSNIIWDIANKIEASNNKIEVFQFTVKEFCKTSKGPDMILFYFKNNLESIHVDSQSIKPYLDKNPKNYKVEIDVKKGLWNHYILESWDIR